MDLTEDRFEMPRRAVVLFAGAGGSSIGLHDAGFEPIGFEYWRTAADTHRANGMSCVHVDLSDPTSDEYIPESPLLWASPPCQPFSAAGDGEGEFDDRDGFPWTLRIIAKRLPAVVIIENVKGLTFTKHHAYFAGILASLRELGYDVDWRVLNSADYGVPQTRERCFIVGRRDGGPITWPMPTHTEHAGMFTEPWVSMLDALPHLPDNLMARHRRGAGMIERYGERPDRPLTAPALTIRQGGGGDPGGFVLVGNNTIAGGALAERSASAQAMTVGTRGDQWTLHYRQTNRDGEPITCDVTERPAPTVGTQSASQWVFTRPLTTINGDVRVSAPGHHDPTVSGSQQAGALQLTIKELARLQDFPDHYVWCGTKTDQAKQIGNAVPATMARVLAEANAPIGVAA